MGKLYLGNQEIAPILYDKEAAVGIPREVSSQGIYQMPASNFSFSLPNDASRIGTYSLAYSFFGANALTSVDLSHVTRVDSYGLQYAFSRCSNLTSVDLSSLETVTAYGCQYMCSQCPSLTSVTFGSLNNASGANAFCYAFSSCTHLTTINFGNLTNAHTQVFDSVCLGCTALTSASFASLTSVGSYCFNSAFYGCTSLTTLNFGSLSDISKDSVFRYAFYNCTSLATLSFPALTTTSFGNFTNQFNNMLQGCTGVTVHFPAAIQSTIGSWASVTSGFGGTNTTVLFDL